MSNHPRTGAPAEPPRRRTSPRPPHDPSQDDAAAFQRQVQQHQTLRTNLTPGGPLQETDPSDPQPGDPSTP
jgi:hypothetical protein